MFMAHYLDMLKGFIQMTKSEVKSLIGQLGARRIVLDSILQSSERIWGGSGYRDIEEETILTKDGIVVELKASEYGMFQKSKSGDIERKVIREHSLEESVDIILGNRLYLELIKNSI